MKVANFFKSLLFGLPVGITFIDFFGYVARVDGISMQPALNPDKKKTDYVFLNRFLVKSYDIKRGDIISLISPKDPSQKIIKRVVGVEGDIIATLSYKKDIIKVPEGHCWIEGNVLRNAIKLGDIDNDGSNELIIGNQNGDVSIYKGREKLQTIAKLTSVSCISVGDVMNQGRNVLIIITADGWCYLYSYPDIKVQSSTNNSDLKEGSEQVDGQIQSRSRSGTNDSSVSTNTGSTATNPNKTVDKEKTELVCIHMQRIPANSKSILLGDIDGDGMIEMVLGLTDRVVRSYRWISNPHKPALNIIDANVSFASDKLLGKFVALNKWECANQIGSITLHHSLDGKAALLIAQPGGTFMRIKCHSEDSVSDDGTENSGQNNSGRENISGSVDYQFLGISRMRNQNISTEILGDLKNALSDSPGEQSCNSQKSDSSKSSVKGRFYAIATLDGTIMLVQDEVIVWAFAVDHQVFALTKLDVTGNGSDDIVVCSWDGQTYILDQEKNSVRFHLDEAVQAFESGYYSIKPNEPDVTCLVYVTFKNTILIYYDIPLKELTCEKFEPDHEKLSKLFIDEDRNSEEALKFVKNMEKRQRRRL